VWDLRQNSNVVSEGEFLTFVPGRLFLVSAEGSSTKICV